MMSKKGKGKSKGKQPVPKKAKPSLPAPGSPVSSGDEMENSVNMAIVQRLEALVQKREVL